MKRQASTTLRYMQMLARMQSEVRLRRTRISEDSSGIQRQMQLKREKELEKLRVSVSHSLIAAFFACEIHSLESVNDVLIVISW